MLEEIEQLERRRYLRVTTKKNSSFVLISDDTKLGEIIDISMGGLAFRYSGGELWSRQPDQSAILFGDDDLWLNTIPLNSVYDFILSGPSPENPNTLRRRSMQFGALSPEQKKLLRQFITINSDEPM